MKLVDLEADIADELLKTGEIDVRAKIADAVLALELANNFAYMRKETALTLSGQSLTLPSDFKTIEALRITTADGFHYPTGVDPRDILSVDTALPQGYYLVGTNSLVFDAVPDQAYPASLLYRAFTTVNVADDDFEPWLFRYGRLVVKYQALTMFGPYVRDPELMQQYAMLLKDAFTSFSLANEEMEYSNVSLQMEYR